MSVTDGYPLDWFKHFDLVLLGDIHLQQSYKGIITDLSPIDFLSYNSGKPTWAYAGSLVQQNFGELPFYHGFLEWDLVNKQILPHWIFNPKVMIKSRFDKDSASWILAQPTADKLTVSGLLKKYAPQMVSIRTIGEYKLDELLYLKEIEKEGEGIYTIDYQLSNKEINRKNETLSLFEDRLLDISSLNSVNPWIDFIETNSNISEYSGDWKAWLKMPKKLFSQ